MEAIATLVLLIAIGSIIILLVKRLYGILLWNVGAMVVYCFILFMGAMQAKGWDGLGWLLVGAGAITLHFTILLIVAIVKEPRPIQESGQPVFADPMSAPMGAPSGYEFHGEDPFEDDR